MTLDDDLKISLICSTIAHIAMLLLLYFGLPSLFKALPPIPRTIPIEIVDISDITNTRTQNQNQQQAKPPEPQSKPQPPAPPPPPTPPTPTPPQVQQKTVSEIAEALLPKPKEKPKPPEPPKPEPKPNNDQLSSLLRNVAKMKTPSPPAETKTPEPTKTPAKPAEPASTAPSLSDKLSISEEDALRRQISQCWNMPVGARDAENLIVEILIKVNPDSTVQSAQVVDEGRMNSDRYFRAAAESAMRALRHPHCTPLQYDYAKHGDTIRFAFDPRDML